MHALDVYVPYMFQKSEGLRFRLEKVDITVVFVERQLEEGGPVDPVKITEVGVG